MSRLEKYLPFILALLAPALSVITGTVKPSHYEWNLLAARYLEASFFILILWYVNQWLINSVKKRQGMTIFFSNVLLITSLSLVAYLFLPLGSSAGPVWFMAIRLCMVAVIFNIILRIFKGKKERAELMYVNLSLQAENLKFQVEALKQQIDPHFMFNSLNTLLELIEEDKEAATEYVRNFSNLYRVVIQNTKHDFVSLKDELKFLSEYWKLLKVRYKNVINLKIEINEDKLGYSIPPLSLQFLIENAIKHNMATVNCPLLIEVLEDKDTLIIRNKMKPKEFPVNSEKVGMQNLQKRFTVLHKPIEYGVVNDHYLVRIPLRTE